MDVPAYYRINDPIQNLRLKITLKRITKTFQRDKENRNTKQNEPPNEHENSDDDDENNESSENSDEEDVEKAFLGKQEKGGKVFVDETKSCWSSVFTWQEKVFGPREILMYRPGGVSGEETNEKDIVGRTAIEMEYREELKTRSMFGANLLKDTYPVCLFSYTDKDGFVPLNQLRKYTSTSEDFSLNPVAKGIITLPKLGGTGKGLGKSERQYGIGQRILRESPSKVYYIMAAVDVDPTSFASRGVKVPEFYEVVLCTIRTDRDSNLVEMRPGLSTASMQNETVLGKSPDSIKSYTFRTPGGSVYQYTIENEAECKDEDTEISLLKAELDQDKRNMLEQNSRVGKHLLGCPRSPSETRFNCFIEIVSAFDFDSYANSWYIQYEVVLPPNSSWKWASTMSTSAQQQNSNIASYVAGLEPSPMLGTKASPSESTRTDEAAMIIKGVTQSAYARDVVDTRHYNAPTGKVAHYAFPIHLEFLHISASGQVTDFPLSEMPQIFFQVKSRDSLERHRIEGYGYLNIPSCPGSYDQQVRTWKPRGSIHQRAHDFLIGGSLQLDSSMYTAIPQASNGSFLNRFGFTTETSGTLRVRLQCIAQRFLNENIVQPENSEQTVSTTLKAKKTKRTVEEILNSLKLGHLARRGGNNMKSETSDLLSSVARLRREKETAKLHEEMNHDRDVDDKEREERESRLARLQARIMARRGDEDSNKP